ncbi:MAG: BBP7 family outer membrane beta-barrel protein [Planctomycetaceae bacterium]
MGGRNRFLAGCVAAAWCAASVAFVPPARAAGEWFVDGLGLPAEACEPYALVEALAMQRAPGGGGPLVLDTTTDLPVITGDSLQSAMAPGIRAVYGRHGPCALGWEVGYVGVYGMVADQLASGSNNLAVPPQLSDELAGLRNAAAAFAKYTSSFDSVEANLLLTQQNWRPARVSSYPHEDVTRVITWDWLAGFRWAGLTEAAALTLTQPGGLLSDTYATRTSNNLFAGQLGFKARADWGLWALDGWLKAGLAGTAISQAQAPIVDYTGDVYPGRSARTADLGGIFDIDVAVSRRIAEHWAIRVGWNSIWLTGVALATNQFDFSNAETAGTTVANSGTFWINGVTLGLEGRW